jgi:hypothetical protein
VKGEFDSIFVQGYEVDGELSAGTGSGVPCRLLVRYDPTNRVPPSGRIFGTRTTYNGLLVAQHAARPYLTFRSSTAVPQRPSVFSAHVVLHSLSQPGDHDSIGGREIGAVSFDRVSFTYSLADQGKRYVSILLQGPSSAWGVFSTRTDSYNGETTVKHVNTALRLGQKQPFSIRVAPHYFHRKAGEDAYSVDMRVRGFALYFETDSAGELRDDEFLDRALAIADDLTTIISFLSRDRVTWYMRSLTTASSLAITVRSTAYRTPRQVDFNLLPVEPKQLRKFLRGAFRRYRTLKARGIDLSLPMLLYVSSFDAQFVEEQFIGAFRALESLVALVVDPNKQTLLERKKFAPLKKVLAREIEKSVPTVVGKMMKEKIGELNRPSFARSLEIACRKLKISPATGLYPGDAEPSLIKTRNTLIHKGHIDDLEFIDREAVRVRALVERALMVLLGWKDLSRAPPRYVSSWLQSVR